MSKTLGVPSPLLGELMSSFITVGCQPSVLTYEPGIDADTGDTLNHIKRICEFIAWCV